MSLTREKEILEQMKMALKEEYEMSDVSYYTWIKPFYDLIIKNNEIDIITSDYKETLCLDYFRRKYEPFIKNYLNTVCGIEGEICYIYHPTLEDKKENRYLNPVFTFEKFRTHEGNKQVLADLKKFMDDETGGILILHSNGIRQCGKTHLLHALAYREYEKTGIECTYATAEMFVGMVIEKIRHPKEAQYDSLYLNTEIPTVLIDDIHFILDKEGSSYFLAQLLKTCKSNRHFILAINNWPCSVCVDEELREILENAQVVEINE